MKVSVIAIHHPEFHDLILHGKRRDNNKWSLPGGGADNGESKLKCAIRELKEETGLTIKDLKYWGKKTVKDGSKTIEVSLFIGKCPKNLNLKVCGDPDDEMMHFKFLSPTDHTNLHVPMNRNILKDYFSEKNKKTK